MATREIRAHRRHVHRRLDLDGDVCGGLHWIQEMADRFRMSDMGTLSYYLGIEVKHGSGEMQLG
jgi:hypothetical protein